MNPDLVISILENDGTYDQWGDLNPELRLMVIYNADKSEEKVLGSIVDYWPDDGY